MDSQHLRLGQIITTDQQRDAVHIAVAPVEAGEPLNSGMPVFLGSGKALHATMGEEVIGVVDPYLKTSVKAGERFWLFLYPGSITSLRHQWSHPAFSDQVTVSDSEMWLRELSTEIGFPYERLVETVREDWWSCGDDENASQALNDIVNSPRGELLAHHLSMVVGRKIEGSRYFRCAC